MITKIEVTFRRLCLPIIVALALLVVYSSITWLARGDIEWWFIDFVSGGNVYWGDDAYRFFLAKTAWTNPEIFWFNFVLPVAVAFDGILVSLGEGSLFWPRALKSIPLVASLFLVHYSCLHLGVRRCWALLASTLLGLVPLYVFVSLSFYGESWLVFFVSLALYFLASGRFLLAAVVVGLMPLIRIESLGFVASFALLSLIRKDLRSLIIVFSPGSIYFLAILILGPGVTEFLAWRFEIMKVYDAVGVWYGGKLSQIIDVLYWPWLLAAVIGLCSRLARPVFPAFAGAAFIVLQVSSSLVFETGSFESRFLMAAFPLMAVGLAIALESQQRYWQLKGFGRMFVGVASGFALLLLWSNLLSVHVFKELKEYVVAHAEIPASVKSQPLSMETYFKRADTEKLSGYREYADVVTRMLAKNPAIKTLVVSDSNVLYFLNPDRISKEVNVVFPLFGYPSLDPVLDGAVTFGYFPKAPFASYYSLDYPKEGDELLLYLDDMRLETYPFHWRVEGSDIYLFSAQPQTEAGITMKPRD